MTAMADSASKDGPDIPVADAEDTPLHHVIADDNPESVAARQAATEWAAEQLVVSRSFDAVTDELVAGGWSADDAAAMVEQARESTRGRRGVRTREDVVRSADRRYNRTLRTVRLMVVVGIVVVMIAIAKVLKF